MSELTDYSGPFNPDLRFEDFSKEFLLRLIKVWQYAWLHLTQAWYESVSESFGSEAANSCELDAWVRMGGRVNPRYAKVANIQLNTISDCLKCLQLPLDNITGGGLFPVKLDIKGKNVATLTVEKCRPLEFFEEKDPERIRTLCPNEGKVMEKYLVHPKAKAIPLRLPPRKSKDEIACVWEYRIEE